jgi:hypothetical protein
LLSSEFELVNCSTIVNCASRCWAPAGWDNPEVCSAEQPILHLPTLGHTTVPAFGTSLPSTGQPASHHSIGLLVLLALAAIGMGLLLIFLQGSAVLWLVRRRRQPGPTYLVPSPLGLPISHQNPYPHSFFISGEGLGRPHISIPGAVARLPDRQVPTINSILHQLHTHSHFPISGGGGGPCGFQPQLPSAGGDPG